MIQKFKEWLFVAFFLGIIIVLLLGFYLNFQEKRQTKKAEADFYMGCLLAVQKNTTFQNHNITTIWRRRQPIHTGKIFYG